MMGYQGGSNAVARWLRFAVRHGDDGDEHVFAQVATPNSVAPHAPPPPFHPQASARADAACTPLAFARRTYAASPPPYIYPSRRRDEPAAHAPGPPRSNWYAVRRGDRLRQCQRYGPPRAKCGMRELTLSVHLFLILPAYAKHIGLPAGAASSCSP